MPLPGPLTSIELPLDAGMVIDLDARAVCPSVCHCSVHVHDWLRV